MKTSEILIKAKSFIDTPEKWTQGEFARDSYGNTVSTENPHAVCFCSYGALFKVDAVSDNSYTILCRGFKSIFPNSPDGITIFNDTHTHEEVMLGWDKAIKIAQSEGD